METFAQCLSILGLICLVQTTGGALFAIHYFILGAYAGFLLNTIAIFRARYFINNILTRSVTFESL